jgi:hypothetical protein
MARLKNGILGGFQGTIGGLEGYILNGQYVIRSRRRKSSKPPTLKQLASWQRMRVVNHFLCALDPFVKLGFSNAVIDKKYNAYTGAIRHQLKNAVGGQYPDHCIDYEKVRLTEGTLNVQDINTSVSVEDNVLKFTWTPNLSYEHGNDHVMLLAYAPALNQAVYNLCGAKRSAGTEVLVLRDRWRGEVIETYLSFKAESSMLCANSIYTGQIKEP